MRDGTARESGLGAGKARPRALRRDCRRLDVRHRLFLALGAGEFQDSVERQL
jgi:hypothetical protein